MTEEFKQFKYEYNNKVLIGDCLTNDNKSALLFLHGAGSSNRKRYYELRRELFKKSFSSLAFDYIGHGESLGELKESSLKDRTNQVINIIEASHLHHPLTIIGSSMSGYTAIKLTEKYNVKNLILFVPAVYDKSAYSLQFNKGFTECIRKKESWKNSDAWSILSKFEGNLLIIKAEKDEVIPNEVINNIYNASQRANYRKILEINNATHQILSYLNENVEIRNEVIKEILYVLCL